MLILLIGSNQDGRTPGITLPSKDAQERLIREAYRKGGLSMKATRFFESHGTGTPVGDPVEASAIGAAFRGQRDVTDPLHMYVRFMTTDNLSYLNTGLLDRV